MKIFTIGHSNHSLEALADLLNDNGVCNLVDIRTAPYSRFSPQFNKFYLRAFVRDPDFKSSYIRGLVISIRKQFTHPLYCLG